MIFNVYMKNIFLVGFMGSGKSSIGKRLSKKLNLNHLDTDRIIEKQNSMSIKEIFNNKDEKFFRKEEFKLITTLSKTKNQIISTGGGLFCNNDIVKYINENSISIYLKYSSEILYERLKSNNEDRPILTHIKNEELKYFIDDLLGERDKYYKKSTITIECNDLTKEEILRKINSLIITG